MVGVFHRGRHFLTGPWFRTHPRVALAVAAGLFVAVFAMQTVDARSSDAIALLSVLPVALSAVAFGAVGGLASAAVGYGGFSLFAVFDTTGHVSPAGWITRAAAMFLLGILLGTASDQTARSSQLAVEREREQLRLEEENRRYSEGIELSDSVLQYVAAAKWMIEGGNQAESVALLTAALDRGEGMVGKLLPPRSVLPYGPSSAVDQAHQDRRSQKSHLALDVGLVRPEDGNW